MKTRGVTNKYYNYKQPTYTYSATKYSKPKSYKKSLLADALTIGPSKKGLLPPKYERNLLRTFHSTQEDYFLSHPRTYKGGKKTQKKHSRKNNKSRKHRK